MGSPPDNEEFRKAVAGVAPLGESRRVVLRPDPPPPLPRQSERDERAALAESLAGPVSLDDAIDSGEELSFLREGVSRQVLRKKDRDRKSTRLNSSHLVTTYAVFCLKKKNSK